MRDRNLSQILFVVVVGVTLFYAPLAYGCTTVGTRLILDGLCGLAIIFWMVHRWTEHGEKRKIQGLRLWLGTVLTIVFMIQAWTMALNAPVSYDRGSGEFEVVSQSISWLPSSINRDASLEWARHVTVLGFLFMALLDMGRVREVRKWIVRGIALSGASIALIGIFQKASGTESMLFTDNVYTNRLFFAAYRYHGNAATFLNLCWPVALALFLRSLVREGEKYSWEKPLWGCCAFFTFIGVWVNTSKAGQVLALFGVLLSVVLYRKLIWEYLVDWRRYRLAFLGVGMGILLGGAMISLRWELVAMRWEDFVSSLLPRLQAMQIAVGLVPESSFLGVGPGAFELFFNRMKGDLSGYWGNAHNDYLQVIIEWGWLGGILWIVFWWGGLGAGVWRSSQRDWGVWGVATGLFLMGVHAIVDFPFQIGSLQFFGVIFLALIWGWEEEHRLRKKEKVGVG